MSTPDDHCAGQDDDGADAEIPPAGVQVDGHRVGHQGQIGQSIEIGGNGQAVLEQRRAVGSAHDEGRNQTDDRDDKDTRSFFQGAHSGAGRRFCHGGTLLPDMNKSGHSGFVGWRFHHPEAPPAGVPGSWERPPRRTLRRGRGGGRHCSSNQLNTPLGTPLSASIIATIIPATR